MNRRRFLSTASAAGLSTGLAAAADGEKKRRVAVIGHTGRGNYGHGLDKVWLALPEARIVGVADADEQGLAKARKRLGTDGGFRDYRRMLAETTPEFVSVCPRHADQHAEMVLAAIEAGVKGIYAEKPFCRTPEEADRILAAGEKHGAKIAVAHRNRYHPALPTVRKLVADGAIGRVLEMRGRGKGDRRGGGEDLWVLGCHIFNLMCYFGGAPQSCSALLRQDGRPVTKDDVQPGAEGLGPLAGDEVHARYAFAQGTVGHYFSLANDDTGGRGYCLQIVGSKGVVRLGIDRDPLAHVMEGNPFDPAAGAREWVPITSAGIGKPEPHPEKVAQVGNHVRAVRDLMAAVDEDRDPLCSGRDGATTVEMICAVFASHREGGKAVAIPLQERGNALEKL
ncbi:MAG: Gfo/Idh/MocA family oxidoreductase [Akkermansiaceae bacterium]|nr:Gfo/Idh/MocA family oxidoreductase [Akkermansiaceae bacterium]